MAKPTATGARNGAEAGRRQIPINTAAIAAAAMTVTVTRLPFRGAAAVEEARAINTGGSAASSAAYVIDLSRR
jgi:hypothetical protein